MDRRQLLQLGIAGVALASAGDYAMAAEANARRTFVLIHGAWHGGWCWRPLAQLLEAGGHRVTTPTLTGLGERAHLQSSAVDLETHITDVVAHIAAEELSDIVLVGHSYGGFVVRGVAAHVPQAIAHVIYLDAFVPNDGETVADYAGADRERDIRNLVEHNAAAAIPPLAAAAFGISDPAQAAWVERRLKPQPARTYLQPLAIGGEGSVTYRRSYVACLDPKLEVFDSTRARIKADSDWRYRELQQGHDVMVTEPQLLSRTLLSLIQA
jgi:pimeloyl-ACP methyl ester carboxylesterase